MPGTSRPKGPCRTHDDDVGHYDVSMESRIVVDATWDPEAGVWVADSPDVPGLVAEADTIDALAAKLEVLIPDLIALNSLALPHARVDLVATRSILAVG